MKTYLINHLIHKGVIHSFCESNHENESDVTIRKLEILLSFRAVSPKGVK